MKTCLPIIIACTIPLCTACIEDNRTTSSTTGNTVPGAIKPSLPPHTVSPECQGVDRESSPEHCGKCDFPCADNQICIAGQCIGCNFIHCKDTVECLCGNKTVFTPSCHYIVKNCSQADDYDFDASEQTAPKDTALYLARAIDLCMPKITADNHTAGIIEASLKQSKNVANALVDRHQVNIVEAFQSNSANATITPRHGNTFIALSTGQATDPIHMTTNNDVTYTTDQRIPLPYRSAHNNKIKTHDACPTAKNINDAVHFHLKLRAPFDAESFSFDFRFFTREYPYYLCTEYNDMFIALLTDENGTPLIDTDHDSSLTDEDANISFDTQGNPISVNSAFFTTCRPPACNAAYFFNAKKQTGCPPSMACVDNTCGQCAPDGDSGNFADLYAFIDTPFDGENASNTNNKGGATSWLTTTVPINGNQVFNLDFYIWDTSDQHFDSTVLIDNFRWNCFAVEDVSTKPSGPKENFDAYW